jgi:hypothetical protein
MTTALGLFLAGSTVTFAQVAKDELNYSASACTAPTAEQFHGNGRLGFRWDSRGFWENTDDQTQTLICPIPFDMRTSRDGSFGIIEVRVNIYDNSHLHEMTARLYATSGADPFAARNPLTNAFTSNPFTGETTLLLSATPPNDTRYLWIEIAVPREVYPAQRSAVIGYRVNRLGF